MKLFDSHCHLYFPQFDADRDAVLARMQEKEMGAVVIGTDFATSTAALALAKQYDFLWASVGLHPTSTEDFDMSKFLHLAQQPKVVAVGECGLDYFRSEKSEEQKERFEKHIELALKLKKTLVIHCREAHDQMLEILKRQSTPSRGTIHCYTSDWMHAEQYLNLGFYLGFTGVITFPTKKTDPKRQTDLLDVIKKMPLDRIVVETDSPYLAPQAYRGTRAEPWMVEEVVKKIAEVRGMTYEEVEKLTFENSLRLFSKIQLR